jgi:hypothetical protein
MLFAGVTMKTDMACGTGEIFPAFLQFYLVIRVYLTFLVAQNTESKFRDTSKQWVSGFGGLEVAC